MAIPRNRISGLSNFRRVRLCGPEAYHLHDHEFGEIFWVDEGDCRHCVNGASFELATGALVFIRPWDRHSFHGPPNRPFYLNNTCFDWRIFQYLKQRYFPGKHALYEEKAAYPKTLHLDDRRLQEARRLFLTHYQDHTGRLEIERYLLNIFSELLPPSDITQPEWDLPDWMEPALRQIHEPAHFRQGVSEFCRLSGRSREHVSREFRKATGRTVTDYIRELRMKHAAFLLEASSLGIMEISLECGFESLSHFYSSFNKAYGTSPRSYRQDAHGKMY